MSKIGRHIFKMTEEEKEEGFKTLNNSLKNTPREEVTFIKKHASFSKVIHNGEEKLVSNNSIYGHAGILKEGDKVMVNTREFN